MDPHPLRLLETAHPLRSRSISQGPPRSPFTIRPNCRLKRPSKLVNKTVNKFIKFVDGPTQMSRPRPRSRSRSKTEDEDEHEHGNESPLPLPPRLPSLLQADDSSSISLG